MDIDCESKPGSSYSAGNVAEVCLTMTRSILWCTLALSFAQSSLVKADNLHAFSLPIQRRQPECVSSVNVTQVYHELVCGLDSNAVSMSKLLFQ